MQQLKSFIFFISLSILLTSCFNQAKNDPLLKEAFEFHTQAMDVEKNTNLVMDNLLNRKNSIQVQGKALSEDDMGFIDAVNRVESLLTSWKDNRVEVPGFEHGHDGHKHHAGCNHKNDVQLTSQQMLEVQEEALKQIKDIKAIAEGISEK